MSCVLLQVRLFESVNFMDFARFLAAFSDRASYEEKVKFIFWVYDVDGDGEWCSLSSG
jgi:serine/threonine-protein phosphatase 2B regulatory subunit